jgi:hypothetical protein
MSRAALFLTITLVAVGDSLRGQESERSQEADRTVAHDPVIGAPLVTGPPVAPKASAVVDRKQPLKFRRVYVPERDLLSRLKAGQRYVPLSAKDFESRVRRIENVGHAAQTQAAQIAYAKYAATLDENSRLVGKGAWHVNFSGEKAALLSLTELRLALRDAHWIEGQGDSNERRRAILGATDAGQLALHVDRSGTVEFDWFLAARRDHAGELSYDLSLPPSPTQELELTLPSELVPVVDNAIISAAGNEQDPRRVWTVRLVGRRVATLRLVSRSVHGPPKPRALLQPKVTYEFSLQGLQIVAEWRVDIHDAPLETLEFDLDPSLTLIGVKLGDAPIHWSETSSDSNAKRMVLEFAEPLHTGNRVIRLTAIAPLVSDGPWNLPVLQPRNVIWQDGTIALLVAAPLSLNNLDLAECRQTKREILPSPAAGEAIGIQALSPSAKVTLEVARRPERLQSTSATTVELFGNEARGSYAVDIVAEQGEHFQLSAKVSPDWIVDSVQSLPSTRIADWDIQRSDGSTSGLKIHLAKALKRDRPLRVIIRATRRRAPLGDTLSVNDLKMLEFEGVAAVRRLVLLQATSPYRLDVRNADTISRLERNQLTPTDRGLLGESSRGLLFLMDDAAEDMEIRLLEEQPRYSATLEARALVGEDELTESYRLRITPESNELDQVKVHFSQSRDADIAWRIGVGGGERLVARRLATNEHSAEGVGNSGEIWEIKLKPARGGPFVLAGERTSKLQTSMPVALPSLLGAASQQGVVAVELATEFTPEIIQRRLKSLAADPSAPGEIQNVLGAFEYDPTEDLLVAREPALVLNNSRDSAHRRGAWIWRLGLDSWFSRSQRVEHHATLLIENTGRSSIVMAVPSAEAPPTVLIDGVQQADSQFDPAKNELELTLPRGRRFSRIDVGWSSKDGSLGQISSRAVAWPTADVPILGRHYAVWLPSEYVLADMFAARHVKPGKTVTWMQRLFGPLGAAEGDETFEPWMAHDWSRLGRGGADREDAWDRTRDFAEQSASDATNTTIADAGTRPVLSASGTATQPSFLREGWVANEVEWPDGSSEFQIVMVRRQAIVAISLGLFFAVAGVTWRFAAGRVVFSLIAFGVLSGIALVVPVTFAPIGAGAVLGLLAGHFFRWCALRLGVSKVQNAYTDRPSLAVVASSCLISLFACSLGGDVSAQPNVIHGEAPLTTTFDVFIPLDEDQQVAGELVYLPEAFYKALLARSDGVPVAKDARYLITAATYEGKLESLTGDNPIRQPDWQATFTVDVFQAPAEVFLAIGSDGANLVPDSGTINGQRLRFGSDEKRKGITFDIEDKGTFSVKLQLRPVRPEAAAADSIAFAIPPVPEANLRLTPGEAERAPAVTALGGTSVDPQSRRVVAELGPIDRVQITPGDGAAPARPTPQFDVDELSWMRLRPGSAVLNTRLAIQVRRGEVDELRLALDEHLQLLALPADSPVSAIERVAGGNELRLTLKRPLAMSAALDLSFAVQGVTGAASFSWPSIGLVGALATRRYAAYTVEPSLEVEAPLAQGMKPMSSAQFAAIWGEAEGRPQAYELPPQASGWRLKVRPRQAKLTSNYRSVVVAGRSQVELEWYASIAISGGSRFQLCAHVPPSLTIDELQVRDSAGVRPSRWAVSRAGMLTLFLDSGATGTLDLTLRGRIPLAKDQQVAVPCLKVEGSTEDRHSMVVLRRSNVLTTIKDRGGLSTANVGDAQAFLEDAEQADETQWRDVLPVAALAGGVSTSEIVLAVARNLPRVAAVQAITVARSDDAWRAVLDLRMSVSGGLLEVVRINVPTSWIEPYRVEPPMRSQVIEIPTESRRQLLLYPSEPIAGDMQIRVEGALSATAGQRIRVPDIRLSGAASLKEFFALPLQQDLQTLAWDTRGLKPEAIPEGLPRQAAGIQRAQTFSRAAEQFRAELRSVEKVTDDFQVRLADIAVSWADDSQCYGTATFDIEPAGNTSCRLALPADYGLVGLFVDGRALRLAPSGDARWQVPLSGGRLPQRIEVVFAGPGATSRRGSRLIEGPKLIGLPVERTLWSVAGPHWAGTARLPEVDAVSPMSLDAARLESTAGLIEAAVNTLADTAPDEAPRWYTPWARRMQSAVVSLRSSKLIENATDDEIGVQAELIEKDQAALAERIGAASVLKRVAGEPPLADTASQVWETSLQRSDDAFHAVLLGESSAIELDYAQNRGSDLARRIVSVLVAAILLLASVALVLYTPLVALAQSRPRVVAVLVGLFWWLFLTPSAFGWLIVAVSILLPQLERLLGRLLSRATHSVRAAA